MFVLCVVYTCAIAHMQTLEDSSQELVLFFCHLSVWRRSSSLVQVFLSAKPLGWLNNCYFLIACCHFVYKSTAHVHIVTCKVAKNYFLTQYFLIYVWNFSIIFGVFSSYKKEKRKKKKLFLVLVELVVAWDVLCFGCWSCLCALSLLPWIRIASASAVRPRCILNRCWRLSMGHWLAS